MQVVGIVESNGQAGDYHKKRKKKIVQNRRQTDPFLEDLREIKRSVDRIDGTLHGNGGMGLKTRVYVLWYGAIIVAAIAGILTGCAFLFDEPSLPSLL